MIDVSQFQGSINWRSVTPSRVLIRVTVGSLGIDAFARANLAGAHDTGKVYGGYHFLEDSNPEVQIDHFLSVWRPSPGNIRGMIDVEPSAFSHPSLSITIGAYRRYKDRTGHYPILYGNSGVLAELHLPADAAKCPLMVADFGVDDGKEHPIGSIPSPWREAAIHQFTDKGRVAGITANTVDLDHVLVPSAILMPKPRPIIDKWEVSYVTKKKGRVRAFSRFPYRFIDRRPRAKYRGAVHIYPHRKEA